MKKPISMLAMLLLLSSAVGCGAEPAAAPEQKDAVSSPSAETAAVTETAEPSLLDAMDGVYDFNGAPFRILITKAVANYEHYYALAEETDGDILNDTAVNCYLAAEDTLNLDIQVLPTDVEAISTVANKTILAGDDSYDMLQFFSSWDHLSSMISSGTLYNLLDVPNMNLTAEYFNNDYNNNFIINNQLYFAFSDFCNAGVLPMHLVFNKKMMQELDMELPYQSIFDGTWTFDRYLSYIAGVSADIDGNNKMEWGDRYGYGNNTGLSYYLTCGFDVSPVKRAEDGSYLPDLQNERLVSGLQKVLDFCKNNPDIFFNDKFQNESGLHIFMNGQTLFSTTGTKVLRLRDISDFDFGIAPFPKYDEAQKDYPGYYYPHQFSFPATISDPALAGAAMEALSILFHERMTPAYVDVYVENKVLRDEESVQIARNMLAGKKYVDILRYYDFDENIKTEKLISTVKDPGALVSALEKKEAAAIKKAEKMFAAFFD